MYLDLFSRVLFKLNTVLQINPLDLFQEVTESWDMEMFHLIQTSKAMILLALRWFQMEYMMVEVDHRLITLKLTVNNYQV